MIKSFDAKLVCSFLMVVAFASSCGEPSPITDPKVLAEKAAKEERKAQEKARYEARVEKISTKDVRPLAQICIDNLEAGEQVSDEKMATIGFKTMKHTSRSKNYIKGVGKSVLAELFIGATIYSSRKDRCKIDVRYTDVLKKGGDEIVAAFKRNGYSVSRQENGSIYWEKGQIRIEFRGQSLAQDGVIYTEFTFERENRTP